MARKLGSNVNGVLRKCALEIACGCRFCLGAGVASQQGGRMHLAQLHHAHGNIRGKVPAGWIVTIARAHISPKPLHGFDARECSFRLNSNRLKRKYTNMSVRWTRSTLWWPHAQRIKSTTNLSLRRAHARPGEGFCQNHPIAMSAGTAARARIRSIATGMADLTEPAVSGRGPDFLRYSQAFTLGPNGSQLTSRCY